MKYGLLVLGLFLAACGSGGATSTPVAFITPTPAPTPGAVVPSPTIAPVASPTPRGATPTPSANPSATPTPAPGVLNCFQGNDVLGNTQVYCTGGNLGLSVMQLENFGASSAVILNVTIDNNANPQPTPIIVCVTELIYDRGNRVTATMCGSQYNVMTNVLF